MLLDFFGDYLSLLAGAGPVCLGSNWFSRFEVRLVRDLLALCTPSRNHSKRVLIQGAVLVLLTVVSTGDEAIGADWLRNYIFNEKFAW